MKLSILSLFIMVFVAACASTKADPPAVNKKSVVSTPVASTPAVLDIKKITPEKTPYYKVDVAKLGLEALDFFETAANTRANQFSYNDWDHLNPKSFDLDFEVQVIQVAGSYGIPMTPKGDLVSDNGPAYVGYLATKKVFAPGRYKVTAQFKVFNSSDGNTRFSCYMGLMIIESYGLGCTGWLTQDLTKTFEFDLEYEWPLTLAWLSQAESMPSYTRAGPDLRAYLTSFEVEPIE